MRERCYRYHELRFASSLCPLTLSHDVRPPIVFAMSKYMPNINTSAVVVNNGDHAILVATHVKNCKWSQVVRRTECRANLVEVEKIMRLQKPMPSGHRLLCRRMYFPKFPQGTPRDYSHSILLYLNDISF